jgi:hypothetical protein
VVFAVFFCSGKKLVKGDEHHDPCHKSEKPSHERFAHYRQKNEVTHQRTQRFGKAAQEREPEGFALASRSIVHRHRNGNTLREGADGIVKLIFSQDGGQASLTCSADIIVAVCGELLTVVLKGGEDIHMISCYAVNDIYEVYFHVHGFLPAKIPKLAILHLLKDA